MLTETQLEVAAREYCRRWNMDPDYIVHLYPNIVHRWERIKDELRVHVSIHDALEVGGASPTTLEETNP